MKRILSGLAMLSLCIPLFAQQVISRVDFGRRQPKPDFYEYSPADNGLVTLGPYSVASNRFLSLTKYDASLKKEWSVQLLEQNGRKTIDFLSVIGNHIFVFVTETLPREDVIKAYYYAYDLSGKVLAEEEILSVYPNEKEQKTGLQFVLSPNKRRLLCYKSLQTKREFETLLYYVFDDEGDFVQNGEVEVKYPDNKFRIRNVRISNNGNLFILGKFYRTQVVREATDFQHIIYQYDIAAQQGLEHKIVLGDLFINDLAFRVDRDENMYVAGFYSNRSTDQIAGTMLQKITPEGNIVMNAIEPFDANFLSNYLSRSQIDRGRELQNFYMDPENGIVLRSDGGVLLFAEKFYITYQSYRDISGYWVEREIFHYDDVVLTSVSAEGRIEWHAIIEKTQQSDNPNSLSFFSAVGAGGAYVFYEYKPRRNGFNVYSHQIGIDGQVTGRSPMFKDYKYGNEFYPRFCEQVSNDEALMVYMQNRGKIFTVARIRLEP
ncbi:MAG: hypothetical protein SF053_17365 [Bacteroidia bacterium]|nr:hypothetical protein [Bacteroidia bacterium]